MVTKLATPSVADANGNNDSGYAPSGVEYVLNKAPVSLPGSPARRVQLPSTTENVSHARYLIIYLVTVIPYLSHT